MKRIILMLIFTFLFSTTCFAQSTTIYENSECHFRFSYPSGWIVAPSKTKDGITVVVVTPTDDQGFAINAVNTGKLIPPEMIKSNNFLEHIINGHISDVKRLYPGAQLKTQSIIKLNNRDAIYIGMNILSTKNEPEQVFDTYTWFYSSYVYQLVINVPTKLLDQNRQVYDEIVNSFEILP